MPCVQLLTQGVNRCALIRIVYEISFLKWIDGQIIELVHHVTANISAHEFAAIANEEGLIALLPTRAIVPGGFVASDQICQITRFDVVRWIYSGGVQDRREQINIARILAAALTARYSRITDDQRYMARSLVG
jgi:hypothetical protein